MKNSKFSVNLMTEMAIFAALGFVLDFLQGIYSKTFWPSGGSVGIAMCAVLMFSFRHGLWGLLCGLVVGILSMTGGLYISGFADNGFKIILQVFLDYIGAWMAVGLAGLFAGIIKKSESKKKKVIFVEIAIVIAAFVRFLCNFTSGILFWPSDDNMGKYLYSFIYNGTYLGISTIICGVVMGFVIWKQPDFTNPEIKGLN